MKQEYLKDVVTLRVDEKKCVGCGMCVTVCPHEVFSMKNGHVQMVNRNNCMECGACAQNCPVAAIDVKQGVGCAYAIIVGKLTGGEPNCGCTGEDSGCC